MPLGKQCCFFARGSFLALSLVIFGCASVEHQSTTSTRTEASKGVATGSINEPVATKKGTPLEALFSQTRVIDGRSYRLYTGSKCFNYFGTGTQGIRIDYVEEGYGSFSLILLEHETRVIDGLWYGKMYVEDPPGSGKHTEVWVPTMENLKLLGK